MNLDYIRYLFYDTHIKEEKTITHIIIQILNNLRKNNIENIEIKIMESTIKKLYIWVAFVAVKTISRNNVCGRAGRILWI